MKVIGVRVKKCDNPQLWYFHCIGRTFEYVQTIFEAESFSELKKHVVEKLDVYDNEGKRNLVNRTDARIGVELDSGVRVWLK